MRKKKEKKSSYPLSIFFQAIFFNNNGQFFFIIIGLFLNDFFFHIGHGQVPLMSLLKVGPLYILLIKSSNGQEE